MNREMKKFKRKKNVVKMKKHMRKNKQKQIEKIMDGNMNYGMNMNE